MEISEIRNIVVGCLKGYLRSQGIDQVKVNANTRLLGPDSVVDSIGLVNVIIDVESTFADKGIELSLTSGEAMSRKKSPFREVSTLADFIVETLEAENA